MVEMRIFNALALFLQPFLFCEAQQSCSAHQNYTSWEFGLCVPHIYNPVEQEVMAGQFHASSRPGVLKNVNMNVNILQRYFTHKSSQVKSPLFI